MHHYQEFHLYFQSLLPIVCSFFFYPSNYDACSHMTDDILPSCWRHTRETARAQEEDKANGYIGGRFIFIACWVGYKTRAVLFGIQGHGEKGQKCRNPCWFIKNEVAIDHSNYTAKLHFKMEKLQSHFDNTKNASQVLVIHVRDSEITFTMYKLKQTFKFILSTTFT